MRTAFCGVILGLGAAAVYAAPSALTAEDYARAERFLPWNESRLMRNGDIQHHWIGAEDRFWYLRTAAGKGSEFVVVDAATGSRSAAFDQQRIASGLSTAMGRTVEAVALPFKEFRYTRDTTAIEFPVEDKVWSCQLKNGACSSKPAPPAKKDEVQSPDGKWSVLIRDHNLWLRPDSGGQDVALTTDGIEYYGYAGQPGSNRHHVTDLRFSKPNPPLVVWSPDSRYVLTYRLDERKVGDMYLVQSVPEDGSVRPKLYKYRYPLPGDADVTQVEPVIFDVKTRKQVKVQTAPLIVNFDPWIRQHYAWWSADSRILYYLDCDRFSKSVTLKSADPSTGAVKTILQETAKKTFILPGDARGGAQNAYPSVRVLKNGDVIWYSERDGWGHLYYYDGRTATLRNQITRGAWIVRDIVRLDEAARTLYFTAGGVDPKRDPYYRHLYSVRLDGSGLKLLTPEDAEHSILTPEKPLDKFGPLADSFASEAEKSSFSASGKYFVHSHSRPDTPPELTVRGVDGRLIASLEKADISALKAEGFTTIEPFRVLAADGTTPLYGNIHRPSRFDPKKKYPIVDSIYPGPQISRAAKGFAEGTFDVLGAQALAELGFVVVTIDGRGTPHRSKAFLDDVYGQMGKAGNLADHVAGIRQLAERFPGLDIDRVGIYGISGGGYGSTHAILSYPDFYKVAVSGEGNHTQLGYVSAWGETFNGPVGQGDYAASANEPLAGNLRGKLLLMHGDLDDNVSPSLTLRVVDRLIKANKDFDLLIMPNGNHGVFIEPYFIRREWDYFVRHLMGAEPPHAYEIHQPAWVAEALR